MAEAEEPLPIKERVKRLLGVVKEGDRALLCTHDNPDPDSIASAYALGRLLAERRGVTYTLTYGGVLGRAENRAMVRLLKIPLVPISKLDLKDFEIFGLVDTQPGVGNHPLTKEATAHGKLICIDHHPARETSRDATYADVGDDFGATSSLLLHYLDAAGVVPDRALATSLFYGIKSDTRDLGREVGPRDVWAYTHLISLCDMPAVSQIEHPPLPREYFGVLVRAMKNAVVYGNVVACDLGAVYVPDLVAEIADRLSSAEGVRWSIVLGEHEREIYASIRVNDRRYSAGKLVREVIPAFPGGSAGGHGSMAGARIPVPGQARSAQARSKVRKAFMKALLANLGVKDTALSERFTDPPARSSESSGPSLRAVGPRS